MRSSDGITRVLLLDEFDDGLAVGVSRCLYLAGAYEVHCLSGSADTILRRSKHCHVRYVPWDGPAGMLSAISAYVERRPIDLVVPIQEKMIVMAGQAADRIERLVPLAPGPDPAQCRRVDDKWSFHQLMSGAGLPVPRATLATQDRASLPGDLGDWATPLLLKPTLGWGGHGIRSFESAGDLLEALDESGPAVEGYLIQEYVPGENLSCNILSVEGEIIASSLHRSVLYQAAQFTSAGLGLEFIRDGSAATVAAGFADASRWTGVANINLRIDSRTGEPVLIEVNPRYWQTVLASFAMGVNFPDLHCRLALGERPAARTSRTGFYLDAHSLLNSPRNIAALMAQDPGFMRYIDRRIMAADPRVDTAIAFRTLKNAMAWALSRVGTMLRRAPGSRNRSSRSG